jgi:membrane protease YdiL (CAAX protease family)
MLFSAFKEMRPFSQFIFAAFIIVACFLTFMAISFAIAIPVFGLDVALSITKLKDLSNPDTIAVLKYFQTIQAIGLFIVPPFVIGYMYSGNAKKYLHLNKPINLQSVGLLILLMLFSAPFINFIGELNSNMSLPDCMSGIEAWMKQSEEQAAEITDAFLNVKNFSGLAFNIFMIAFLPAIGEELLFRGVIQKIFTKMTKNHHAGIWISAILFSALHMQFYGFVPRVILGAIFGYLLVYSGSIWLPITGHFLNNAIAVISMFFINKGVLSSNYETIGSTTDSYYIAFISFAFIIVLITVIKRINTGKKIPINKN